MKPQRKGLLKWILHQNKDTEQVETNCLLFPVTKDDILSKKSEFCRRGTSAKLGKFTLQQENQ